MMTRIACDAILSVFAATHALAGGVPVPVSPRKAGNGGGGAIAGDYDFFANIRYPATRRPDVALDKIEQKGGPDAVGYKKRVVHWWPKQGVDVIDVPEGAPLRTWTIRTPEEAPLTALAAV